MSDPRTPDGSSHATTGDPADDDANPLSLLAEAGTDNAKAARKQARRASRTGRQSKVTRREHGSGSAAEPVSVSTTIDPAEVEQADRGQPTPGASTGPSGPRRSAGEPPAPRSGGRASSSSAGSGGTEGRDVGRPSDESRSRRGPSAGSGSGPGGPAGAGGSGGGRGRRRPKPTPVAAQGAGASVQGLLLVGLAVVIGAVLLIKGYDRENALATAPPTSADVSTTVPFATTPTGPTPSGASSTTVPLKPPSEVQVLVGKAGAPEGVATAGADKLRAAGYKSPRAIDSSQNLPASKVYFQPGYQAEAIEVAKVFKIPDSSVAAMPTPPPDQLQGATVLVLLGPEARKDA